MEHEHWKAIVVELRRMEKCVFVPGQRFTDDDIVGVYFWAVIHDRPIQWACRRCNWPIWRRKKTLPSQSTMSRRLRSPSVRHRLESLDRRLVRPSKDNLLWFIDGKPLTISGVSKDRQAGYGRAAGAKAKGYKLHAIVGSDNSIAAWRVAPMNVDERKMAERLLKTANIQGYVVADSNYDSNRLHDQCDIRGNLQLVSPRRGAKGGGTGHRKQTPGRMRCKDLLENPCPKFGKGLLKLRSFIERYYGNLSSWGGGLTSLPPWVRTHRRVHLWVQGKLILQAIKRARSETTYVA